MSGPKDGEPGRSVSPYSLLGLGFEIAVPVVLFSWAGYLLDGWLDSGPWLLLVGAFLGISVGFYSLFKRVRALTGNSGENRE